MPYVQRKDGAISGVFINLQPGYAEEELADDNSEVMAFLSPTSSPYSLPKLLLWTRLTDSEAEQVAAAMKTQPARMQGIWEAASEVRSDSEFFGTLEAFLTAVLGGKRAAEVLANA